MQRYAKLKDGSIWIVWSDNTTEKTMNLIDLGCCDEHGSYDPENFITKEFPYSDIVVISTDRTAL